MVPRHDFVNGRCFSVKVGHTCLHDTTSDTLLLFYPYSVKMNMQAKNGVIFLS